MSKFIKVTIVKDSEEGLEEDSPILVNSHYIIKVMHTTEDEHGNASIALATGEFLFLVESYEELMRMLGE
jgi:hypothetical protein